MNMQLAFTCKKKAVIVCFFNSQKLQMKVQVADAFLSKFQLKPEEIKILRGTRDGQLHKVSFTVVLSTSGYLLQPS